MEALIYVAIAFIHPSKLDEGHVCDLERSANEKLKRLKARLSRGKVGVGGKQTVLDDCLCQNSRKKMRSQNSGYLRGHASISDRVE